jgi:predicted anti-sigma-YlaC factor YlaD
MLTCAEVVRLLTDYLDHALAPDVARRVEKHLGICPPCRGYLSQMHETKKLLGRLSEDDLPREIQDELVAAFRHFHEG